MFSLKSRLLPAVFIALVAVITLATFFQAPGSLGQKTLVSIGRPTRMAEDLERYFGENLAVREPLRNLYLLLRTVSGTRELGDFYLADGGLIPRFTPTEDSTIHRKNTETILAFASEESTPTAVMLLPTPIAIYQERLPPYAAEIQFNQRGYIESVNQAFAGTVAAVDVYSTLFAARKEYLYYRTDSSLTSRGGYLVYQNLANRLGFSPRPESSFRQQFLGTPYYGDLYRQWGYGGVRWDTVSLYRCQEGEPQFTVRHWLRFEEKSYHTLYPSQADVSGNPKDVILGGHSPRIDIENLSLPSGFGRLLILGDGNTLSYLPFLALHYRQITFADPDLLTDSELAKLVPSDYSQVLFSFSLERYMNSNQPARAAQAGTATQ